MVSLICRFIMKVFTFFWVLHSIDWLRLRVECCRCSVVSSHCLNSRSTIGTEWSFSVFFLVNKKDSTFSKSILYIHSSCCCKSIGAALKEYRVQDRFLFRTDTTSEFWFKKLAQNSGVSRTINRLQSRLNSKTLTIYNIYLYIMNLSLETISKT